MPKITPTMRRMVLDREFFEAIAMLVAAKDKFRDLTPKRINNRDGYKDHAMVSSFPKGIKPNV